MRIRLWLSGDDVDDLLACEPDLKVGDALRELDSEKMEDISSASGSLEYVQSSPFFLSICSSLTFGSHDREIRRYQPTPTPPIEPIAIAL